MGELTSTTTAFYYRQFCSSTGAVGVYVIGTRIPITERSGGLVCVSVCVFPSVVPVMCPSFCSMKGLRISEAGGVIKQSVHCPYSVGIWSQVLHVLFV